MKSNWKSIRIPEASYTDIRDIQHDKRYNTLKEAIEYLINLYKGNE